MVKDRLPNVFFMHRINVLDLRSVRWVNLFASVINRSVSTGISSLKSFVPAYTKMPYIWKSNAITKSTNTTLLCICSSLIAVRLCNALCPAFYSCLVPFVCFRHVLVYYHFVYGRKIGYTTCMSVQEKLFLVRQYIQGYVL